MDCRRNPDTTLHPGSEWHVDLLDYTPRRVPGKDTLELNRQRRYQCKGSLTDERLSRSWRRCESDRQWNGFSSEPAHTAGNGSDRAAAGANRWDEKAGLQRDALSSHVIDAL